MKDPLLRNLPAILLGIVIVLQILLLTNLVSIKLTLATMDTPCGNADYHPCKVTMVPYR